VFVNVLLIARHRPTDEGPAPSEDNSRRAHDNGVGTAQDHWRLATSDMPLAQDFVAIG
jgi:hypothetical protein